MGFPVSLGECKLKQTDLCDVGFIGHFLSMQPLQRTVSAKSGEEFTCPMWECALPEHERVVSAGLNPKNSMSV